MPQFVWYSIQSLRACTHTNIKVPPKYSNTPSDFSFKWPILHNKWKIIENLCINPLEIESSVINLLRWSLIFNKFDDFLWFLVKKFYLSSTLWSVFCEREIHKERDSLEVSGMKPMYVNVIEVLSIHFDGLRQVLTLITQTVVPDSNRSYEINSFE